MRKLLLAVIAIAALAFAGAAYLVATVPRKSAGVRFPLSGSQLALLQSVPSSAEAFALVPTAAAMHAKLLANQVTRGPLEQWTQGQPLPRPWMIGGADLAVWRSGKRTSYAVRLDPVRAALMRIYLLLAGTEARLVGGTFLINASPGEPLGAEQLGELLALAPALPPGDALIVQRESARGAFPPVGRPAVTSLQIGAKEIFLTSRAASLVPIQVAGASPQAPITPQLPTGALLSAAFVEPPRVTGDLDRLLGTKVSSLLADGGSIILYDVETGTLLPRPRGLIAVSATPEKREAVQRISRLTDEFGEVRESGGRLLVAFDRTSAGQFEKERMAAPPWPATDWAARIDPKRLVPLLEDLGDNPALRFAAPRLYRAARDLRRWIRGLSVADSIDVVHSAGGGAEELRVRVVAK